VFLWVPTLHSSPLMYVLYLVPESAAARESYAAFREAYLLKPFQERDAGFDLACESKELSAGVGATRISQQVRAACFDTETGGFRAYWMSPRSSISKTPLRLANSLGLIDAGYRGVLLAAVDLLGSSDFAVHAGDRYFQAVTPDLLPWADIQIVDEIPGGETLRGAGGFGSTGLRSPSGRLIMPPLASPHRTLSSRPPPPRPAATPAAAAEPGPEPPSA